MCWQLLGHRRKPPLPSKRGTYRPLASGAEGKAQGVPKNSFGSPVRLHCTAAWPSALWPPSFLRTAGPAQGRAPWRGGSRGPGGGRSHRRPPASAASPCRVALSVLPSPAPCLRPCVPWWARFGFPPPAAALLCHRWAGPAASGSWGAGGFLAPAASGGAAFLPVPPVSVPRPPSRPFLARRARCGGCAAALTHTEMVLACQPLREAAKTGQGQAAVSIPPGSVPFQLRY